MKELSIVEKAKAYDEAIEKIQKYVKDDYGCTRLRPEDIFPELKESEDEVHIKQGEQKTTYNVEPKFHKGDWIVHNDDGCICQIKSISEDDYCLWPLDSDIEGYLKITDIDNKYHLWTIKDAKDRDILVSKSGNKIFSYRGNLDLRGNPCAYYGIYKVHDGICFSPCAIGNSFTCEEVFPATKEQRKILFEERTAAGGVLHFSKKELKKIDRYKQRNHEVMKARKWYSTKIKPDTKSDLIIMTDMGYIFQAIYEDGKFLVSNVKSYKVYFDEWIEQENIIKWMKV